MDNEEKRDTSGDTKVFQVIRREDIEREKKRQAIEKENIKKNKNENEIKNKKENITHNQNGSNKVKENTAKTVNEKASVKVPVTTQKTAVKVQPKIPQGKPMENTKPNVSPKVQPKIQSNETTVVKQKTQQTIQTNSQVKYNNYEQKNKNEKLNDYQSNSKNKNQTFLKAILLIIIFILIAIIILTIFGVVNLNNNKIINGIKINNINVSKLTKEDAVNSLNANLNNNDTNIITIKRNDYEKQIRLKDIKGKFDVESSVNDAYNIGREKDLVSNNYKIIGMLIAGTNLNANFTYDEQLLEEMIDEISLEMPDLAIDSSYIIEGNKLIIKNSTEGIKIQKDSFKQSLINAFSGSQKEFELPVEKAEKQEINIEKIHDEIYKEPVNAYYTTEPFKVYKEEYGLDFAISVEQATQMLQENKTEYEIDLKEIKPQITVEDLGDAAFPDTLATFTTTYGTADVNRNANIALAAQSINSVVVMPGETFSYNDLIGECSTARGYKASTIYLNGKLSTGIGGGICQVSTTLYNAVLRANLEIVQRRNHSLGVTYVPAGQDAMVNIGTSDFKFKNNREYPVKVVAYVNPGSVTCAIKGLKQETEYEVKLESRTIEKTDVKYKVETYKVLYLNGKVVSRTWLSTDTYKNH